MPEVGRKMKLWRYEVGVGVGVLALETIKKKRKERETAIHCTKWLSVLTIHLLSKRWQEWAGVRYHNSAEVEWQIHLPSIRPAICLSVCASGGGMCRRCWCTRAAPVRDGWVWEERGREVGQSGGDDEWSERSCRCPDVLYIPGNEMKCKWNLTAF